MVSIKSFAKPLVRKLTAAVYTNRPLHSWPPLVGQIHGISVPKGVIPNPTPQPVGSANINNLIRCLEMTRGVTGDVAECGVYRGASLIPMAVWARETNLQKTFFGFDSFEGFAESIVKDQQMGGADIECKHPGGMNETSYELVAGKLKAFDLHNVQLRKGFFDQSLPSVSGNRFSFVHLDCDAYDPYLQCLNFFYPRMNPGGIILFDEYNDPPWPGCNAAVDEFLETKPERLRLIALDNFQKYYIVKE